MPSFFGSSADSRLFRRTELWLQLYTGVSSAAGSVTLRPLPASGRADAEGDRYRRLRAITVHDSDLHDVAWGVLRQL